MGSISEIKIYKFKGLPMLKNNPDYEGYLIVCIRNKERRLWYQFPGTELWDNDKAYLESKLGIDIDTQRRVIKLYNKALRNKSYKELNTILLTKIKGVQVALTDAGIVLSTESCPDLNGGMYWHFEEKI